MCGGFDSHKAPVTLPRRKEMKEAVVLDVGCDVILNKGIEGKILQICIRETGTQYQVVWWCGSTRKCEWLESQEVEPTSNSPSQLKIGFNR